MKIVSTAYAEAQERALEKAESDRDWYRGMLSDLTVAVGTAPSLVVIPGTATTLPIPKGQHLRRAYRRAATALGHNIREL